MIWSASKNQICLLQSEGFRPASQLLESAVPARAYGVRAGIEIYRVEGAGGRAPKTLTDSSLKRMLERVR